MKKILLLLAMMTAAVAASAQENIQVADTYTFYDTGGADGAYANNEDYTVTFRPEDGGVLSVSFSAFSVESGWDYLYIYDGESATDTLLVGTYDGTALPPDFAATNAAGALTFRFTSDGSETRTGWEALIARSVFMPLIASDVKTFTSVPQEINFTGSVVGTEPPSLSWSWDFNGDGEIDATTQEASYTYRTVEKHTVTLTVSDGTDTETARYTVGIHILTASDVDFDTSTGTITNYLNTSQKDIIIPNNFNGVAVTSISSSAFSNNALTSVTIPESVTSIGSYAFQDNNLTSVTIPESVTSISSSAFSNNALTSVTIPESVTSIGSYAFIYNALTSVALPESLMSMGYAAFADNNLGTLVLPDHSDSQGFEGWVNGDGDPVVVDTEGNYTVSEFLGSYAAVLPYTLTADDVEVRLERNGSASIIACTSLGGAKLTIPSSLTIDGEEVTIRAITDGVFALRNLVSVDLPESLEYIGGEAFYNNALTEVTIPESVTSIGYSAFQDNNLTSVTIPESVTSIGSFAFGYNALTSVTIPESVTSIGYSAFQDNNLTSVTIPESVTSIGYSAFQDNNLTSVTIPESVTSISSSAFSNNALTSVTIPESVTSISSSAFSNNALTSVTIPESVTSIGSYAFLSNNLTSVTIPESVTSIGYSAFQDNNLTSVTIPESVTSIGYSAFQDNNLTSVTIPESVTSIGSSAFRDNNLTSVTIPESVISIGKAAFNTNAISEINGVSSNGIIYARQTDGTEDVSTIVSYGGASDEVDFIPNSVISIGSVAFGYNALTSVTIPESVTSIGSYAFLSNNLSNVSFEENSQLIYIGQGAFSLNNLISVGLPTPEVADVTFNKWVSGSGEELTAITNFSTDHTALFDENVLRVHGARLVKNLAANGDLYSVSLDVSLYNHSLNSLTINVKPEKGEDAEFTLSSGANTQGHWIEYAVSDDDLSNTVSIEGNDVVGDTYIHVNENGVITFNALQEQEAPAAPTVDSLTAYSITLNAVAGCEYSIDNGDSWQAEPLFADLNDGTSYTFVQRYAETATHKASPASAPLTAETLAKAAQEAPAAPTAASKTHNSITLNAVEGCEYSIDNGDSWQAEPLFADLEDGTSYTFVQRYAETATHKASPKSEALALETDTLLRGTVSISGVLQYGKTLSISITEGNNTGTLSYQWQRDGAAISGATADAYTLVEADINTMISVIVSSSAELGTIQGEAAATIAKADQSLVPATPTEADVAYNSITLTEEAGCEYSIDNGATWQSGVTFTDLNDGTSYTFVQRYAETATHKASPASAPLTAETLAKAVQEAPAAPTAASKTHNSITLNAVEGCEYSINNGDSWQAEPLFADLEDGKSYSFVQRYAETATHKASPASAPLTAETLAKAAQEAPAAPTAASKTHNSITLNAVEGCEYSINNGDSWQAEPLFADLNDGTSYTFVQRYAETATHKASPASAKLTLKTQTVLSGTATISGTLKYGEVLSAELMASNNTGTLSYQWQRNGTDINGATASTYTLIEADITTRISVKITSSVEVGYVLSAATVAIGKAEQEAPAAPILASQTYSSITLSEVEGCEYSIDNGTTWQDAVLFSGLETDVAYTLVQRCKATATHHASPASEALTVTTTKAEQSAPAAPTLDSKTHNSITLSEVAGCEYSIDGGTTWQDAVLFSGLETDVAYTLVQRCKATATHHASPASEALTVTTTKAEQSAPAAPILASQTYSSITLSEVEGCEYSIDNGSTWQDSVLFEGLESSTSYTFVQRYAKTETHNASPASEALTVTTTKAEQSAPAAPTLDSKTHNSITLSEVAGCEYSIDGGTTWQDAVLFSGLESDSTYAFVQRYKTTTTHHASPASEALTIKTIVNSMKEQTVNHYSLYPNPARTEVFVNNAPIGSRVVIYDDAGVSLLQETVTSSEQRIDLSSLSAGVYLVRVGGIVQRLMVQ